MLTAMTVATWIAAIATVVLAIGAIITAVFAIRAFGKQSAELAILNSQASDQRETNSKLAAAAELQARELSESLEERKRDREREHRAQAEQVYVTVTRTPGVRGSSSGDDFIIPRAPVITAAVHNYSQQIIRDVRLQWHKGSEPRGEPNPEPLGELIPGADKESERQFPADADLNRCGAVVMFRDAASTTWLRRPDGDLQEGENVVAGKRRTPSARWLERAAQAATPDEQMAVAYDRLGRRSPGYAGPFASRRGGTRTWTGLTSWRMRRQALHEMCEKAVEGGAP